MSEATNRTRTPSVDWPAQEDPDGPAGRHKALLTRLRRGQPMSPGAEEGRVESSVPRWLEATLRTPLVGKLFGANVLLVIVAAVAAIVARHQELTTTPVITVVVIAFVLALLVNTALVLLAVRPLRVLERTVDMIWRGDLAARVPISMLADRHVMRVSRMFNILLDGLVSDRARTRRLATDVINAADKERAAISRELHDSAAQSLAALAMQLSVGAKAADTASRAALKERIETAHTLAVNTLEEVRLLAHTMHPRVLDDLGLIAALKRLARDTADHLANYQTSSDVPAVTVEVVAEDGSDTGLQAPVMSVLYRVAQEAVQNSRRHAKAESIEIRFRRDLETASIEIVDDGRGFDPNAGRDERAGIGLFTMRERVALVDGTFRIQSGPRTVSHSGTSVFASVPLHTESSPTSARLHQ